MTLSFFARNANHNAVVTPEGYPDMKVRNDAPRTSVKAAIAAYPKAGTQRARIVELLHCWEGGLTDAQMQRYLKMPESSQRPRRVELVEGGWVEDSGDRRAWCGHGEAIVWTLTEAARREAVA